MTEMAMTTILWIFCSTTIVLMMMQDLLRANATAADNHGDDYTDNDDDDGADYDNMMLKMLLIMTMTTMAKVREIFKQQKPAPDIERLHPAELVGTFSRYK